MSVPQRISMVTLGVADVAASTAFYERLGWKRSAGSQESVTFFQTDGSVLGLYGRDELADDAQVDAAGSGFRGVTCALNCGSEAEVDAVYAAWVDAGASPVKPPQKVFWGGYSSYVADPDGHLWELAHNPYSPIGPDGRMQLPGPLEG
jgi:predicted lactoylglutathione lyase